MQFFKPKTTLHWTFHVHNKMRQYHLSEGRVKRVMHTPARTEEGIAENTIAFMQRIGNVGKPQELWVMVQDQGSVRKVISAWRYPGVTKVGNPLPDSVRQQLERLVEEASMDQETGQEKID